MIDENDLAAVLDLYEHEATMDLRTGYGIVGVPPRSLLTIMKAAREAAALRAQLVHMNERERIIDGYVKDFAAGRVTLSNLGAVVVAMFLNHSWEHL